jgi:hypothetical protein
MDVVADECLDLVPQHLADSGIGVDADTGGVDDVHPLGAGLHDGAEIQSGFGKGARDGLVDVVEVGVKGHSSNPFGEYAMRGSS